MSISVVVCNALSCIGSILPLIPLLFCIQSLYHRTAEILRPFEAGFLQSHVNSSYTSLDFKCLLSLSVAYCSETSLIWMHYMRDSRQRKKVMCFPNRGLIWWQILRCVWAPLPWIIIPSYGTMLSGGDTKLTQLLPDSRLSKPRGKYSRFLFHLSDYEPRGRDSAV